MSEFCLFFHFFTYSRRQQQQQKILFFFKTVSTVNLREKEKALKGISL